MLTDVSDAEFGPVVLQSQRPVLVDYWRESCGPCRMLAVVLENLAASQDAVRIVRLDVEKNPVTAAANNVTSVPTMHLFHEGMLHKSIVGPKTKAKLLEELEEFFPTAREPEQA